MALSTPLVTEHWLTNEQIARLESRIEALIEAIGPRDANDILDLSCEQRHQVVRLWEWIDDELGEPDDDA